MTISDLVKQLFAIMGKHGDLDVVGEVELVGKALHLKSVGASEEESQILPQIFNDKEDSTYL